MAKSPRITPKHSAMANLTPIEEAELAVRIAKLECERKTQHIIDFADSAIERMQRAIRNIEEAKQQHAICFSEGLESGAAIADIESEEERRIIYLATTVTDSMLTAVSNASLPYAARNTVDVIRANQKRDEARVKLFELRGAE